MTTALGDMDPLLTPNEVAEMFGVQPRTVREWINTGKLKGVKIPSGRWRVSESVVIELMQELYGGEPK